MTLTLIIGNQNYSSWSLRPWLLLTAFNLEFATKKVWLSKPCFKQQLMEYAPIARVPVLLDQGYCVWDSLAICEYVNEKYLAAAAWPVVAEERAHARALCCEMHSGFAALRDALPMNIRAQRTVAITAAVAQDIERIERIFSAHHPSGWLFEHFGITDCFFAPVALRFKTYDIHLSAKATAYMTKLLAHPSLQSWIKAALQEEAIIAEDEAGEPR